MTNIPEIRDVLISSDVSRWENEGGAISPSPRSLDGMNSMRITIITAMALASLTVYALSFV